MLKVKIASMLLTLFLTPGCETVYHRNTVYQLDAVSSGDEDPALSYVLDTGLNTPFKPTSCTADHYGGTQPYNVRPRHCGTYDNGYCCAWVTEFSSKHVCMEEWCYWEDTCEWALNGWGEECFLIDGEEDGQSK